MNPEHPENDLSDDADYANRLPPEPHDLDELADQVDPLVRADRNRASTRQAIRYGVVAVLSSLAFGLVLAVVFRLIAGSQTCEAYGARLLCTPLLQGWWAGLVNIPPVAFLIGAMVIMVRKLNAYLRWRPWMGVFWVLLPFAMWVMTTSLQIGMSDSPAL